MHDVLAPQRSGFQPVASHLNAVTYVQPRRRIPFPAVRPVAHRHEQLPVLPLPAVVDLQLDLRAQKVEVPAVAGEQLGAFDRDVDAVVHDVVALVVIPAVLAAPPHALASPANDAFGIDVVRADTAVFLRALHPRFSVVENPLFVLVVARVQIGIGHQRSSRQAVGRVALQDESVEQIDDLLAPR